MLHESNVNKDRSMPHNEEFLEGTPFGVAWNGPFPLLVLIETKPKEGLSKTLNPLSLDTLKAGTS